MRVGEKTAESVVFFSCLRADALTSMGHQTVCVEGERMDEPNITVHVGRWFRINDVHSDSARKM